MAGPVLRERRRDRLLGADRPPRFPHRLHPEGKTLYAWCAWDALFLPELLGRALAVESVDAHKGEPIALTVTPEGIETVRPSGTVLSMLQPRPDMLDDVVASFCHHVHFFASRESGRAWIGDRPDVLLLTPAEGHALGRFRNRNQFGDALGLPLP